MKSSLVFLLSLVCSYFAWSQPDTAQKIVKGRKNSPEQQKKPYVILISGDGFRYDYAKKYDAKTLLAFSAGGIRATAMIPSYPTLTFPNHYSLITGLYPSHHGLVSNYFYDRKKKEPYAMKDLHTVQDGSWYDGTPLWVLAEQQHMLTASFYWVGSEAPIKGVFPTYYYSYNEDIPVDRRLQIVINWLELPPEVRPHLITIYFPEVDHAGHVNGPDSPKTGEAVRWLDSTIKKLTDGVSVTGLPVNFIFVSDHGMTTVDTKHPLPIPAAVDTNLFFIPKGAEMMALYAKNKSDISKTYNRLKKEAHGFTPYLVTNTPPRLHYGKKDDLTNRIGDILLVPTWPRVFNFWEGEVNPGAHGFDPALIRDMRASFYAWGPAFKTHMQIPAFENVNVYPVVARILGLTYTEKIDGKPGLADKILKQAVIK